MGTYSMALHTSVQKRATSNTRRAVMNAAYETCAHCQGWLSLATNCYDRLKLPNGHIIFAHHYHCSACVQDDTNAEVVETVHRECKE